MNRSNHNLTCHVAPETIEFAREKGINGPLFDEVIRTQDSGKPEDVRLHRGLETHLNTLYGFKSPTYGKNCGVLHLYDGPENWE
jgi:hypothetical protein